MIHAEIKKVLVAPLDWGAGHATRCIPVIQELIAQNVTPILAGSKQVLERLNREFPHLQQLHLPDQNIKYSRILPAWLTIFWQAFHIKKHIKNEKKLLQRILQEYQIDALISDNRYGLGNCGVPSVIITHQLNLQFPLLLKPFGFITQHFIDKKLSEFDQIWIPDHALKPNLSGNLSATKQHNNVQFIGTLSRFKTALLPNQKQYDVAIILSGPAPQPEILLQKILNNLPGSITQIAVLSNIHYAQIKVSSTHQLHWFVNATDDEFCACLAASTSIIARSGYSTLMDLIRLHRNALLIATPGQTEQTYLAQHFEKHVGFVALQQHKISPQNIYLKINELKRKGPPTITHKENTLKTVMEHFLKS